MSDYFREYRPPEAEPKNQHQSKRKRSRKKLRSLLLNTVVGPADKTKIKYLHQPIYGYLLIIWIQNFFLILKKF